MSEARVTPSRKAERMDPHPGETDMIAGRGESFSPGSVLRHAREARGQSISDVAQVIRFSPHQIDALERDDYASLPGATSVRGMVRNYARFVKLDAAPLLAQLEPAVPVVEAEVRPPANMGAAEQPAILTRVPLKLVAAAAVILLLVLAGYWYVSFPGSLLSYVPGAAVTSGPISADPVAGTSAAPVVAPVPALVAATQLADAVGTQPADANSASGSPPFAGPRIEFDDRSWIEIRDATQKIVFVGEYPGGTRQNVEGTAPFQVWIGKASAVRVFMGERSIDLKPYTREEVARFTLE